MHWPISRTTYIYTSVGAGTPPGAGGSLGAEGNFLPRFRLTGGTDAGAGALGTTGMVGAPGVCGDCNALGDFLASKGLEARATATASELVTSDISGIPVKAGGRWRCCMELLPVRAAVFDCCGGKAGPGGSAAGAERSVMAMAGAAEPAVFIGL